jgi:hypothetical protein
MRRMGPAAQLLVNEGQQHVQGGAVTTPPYLDYGRRHGAAKRGAGVCKVSKK